MRDSEHVGVNRHGRFAKRHSHNHISGLASHSGQLGQLLHSLRHYPAKLFHKRLGKPFQVSCLTIWVGNLLNILEYFCIGGTAHSLSIRVCRKERRSVLVHTLVCTLGRQHHRHYQFKRVPELKFALRIGKPRRQLLQHNTIALFCSHY